MTRFRTLFATVLLGSAIACADPVTPRPGGPGGGYGSGTVGQTLAAIVGVVEQSDEGRFGLRQADRLVLLVYANEGALVEAIGKEVVLLGTFMANGEFAISAMQIVDQSDDDGDVDAGDALSRARRDR